MSVTAQSLPAPAASANRLGLRLVLALAAVAAVAGAVAALAWLFGPSVPPPTAKNPFGVGVREAAPSAQGLGAWILAVQGGFYRSLQAAVLTLKADGQRSGRSPGSASPMGCFMPQDPATARR